MRKWNFMLICLLVAQNLIAQTVETVVSHPKIVDGVHIDVAGNIYTSPGGLMGGTAIGKAMPDGNYDPNFRTGFNGPIDIDENSEGVLFVTNYDNNTLKSYDPITDELTTILTGLDGPAGLTLDSENHVFITCFGAPLTYSGDQIIKVWPNGDSEVWLETSEFLRPQGITFDDAGNLWVANTPTGKIFKIDTLTKVPELILNLGAKVGNLVFRHKDQKFYFPSQDNHKIYRMDLQGNLEILAGSGSLGSADGEALTASFNKPLGLGFTASEDTLYVSESGKLRRILSLDGTPSGTYDDLLNLNFKIIPNPSSGSVLVEIPEFLTGQNISLSIADNTGRIVFKKQIIPTEKYVNLDHLEAGTWYISFYAENIFIVEKALVF
ncbi:MAG TPA: hypothetical protein PKA00_22035 [Saprospiraceae bacterium]|nr:hypothetical protein [Saprospiraceae bacterium]HMQ85608.1 hypothetical protein [Saprospiraceae bacterium]